MLLAFSMPIWVAVPMILFFIAGFMAACYVVWFLVQVALTGFDVW